VTTIKPGDRVRVTARARMARRKLGAMGTVLRLSKSSAGGTFYTVSLDSQDSGVGFIFFEDEIELYV
jgi:hypothetical protein